ncbi:hypothetical protein BKA56DRAFT_690644 [Ilyonectria sp. MPI-CAGE-AT-0026]|nr:hypothetical protein BKA56DRAFT_690644 [Ilyonectria sp. MPI-CAGE-AT-0026]
MARTLVHQEVKTLNHGVDKVWFIISDFSGVTTWAPTVSECTVEGEGLGAVRTLSESGVSFQEKLEVLDQTSHTISYRIVDPTPFPMTGFYGTLHLEPEASGKTILTWTAEAESIDDEGLKVVAPVMNGFINTSIAGLCAALDKKTE